MATKLSVVISLRYEFTRKCKLLRVTKLEIFFQSDTILQLDHFEFTFSFEAQTIISQLRASELIHCYLMIRLPEIKRVNICTV